MFFGQYDHNIDEKGRFTIPSRYRDLLEGEAFITLGFDDNLIVIRKEDFNKLYQKARQMSITSENGRELSRSLFGNAELVEIDKNGRVLIPIFLREKTNLGNSVKVIGVGSYFEIWPIELWQTNQKDFSDGESRAKLFEDLELTF